MTRVLLLGGYGFIGTNIMKYVESCESLREQYSFIVFDRIEKHPHGVKFSNIEKTYFGDFSDESCIEQIFKENEIDCVLHSLSSTVPATSGNACYDVETNLVATLKLLGVMDRYDVKRIVYISSGGAVYGDVLQKVHNEEDAVYPKSSYGVVKLAIEKYLLSYAELYGFKTLILRLSNPFGKYHYNNRQGVINIAARKAVQGGTFQIWGDGEGVKDYIFIEDFCQILFRLIGNGVETDIYNVGGGLPLSVNEICRAMATLNQTFSYKHTEASNLDVQSFELDITKLRKSLGHLSYHKFEDSLRATYKWEESKALADTQSMTDNPHSHIMGGVES